MAPRRPRARGLLLNCLTLCCASLLLPAVAGAQRATARSPATVILPEMRPALMQSSPAYTHTSGALPPMLLLLPAASGAASFAGGEVGRAGHTRGGWQLTAVFGDSADHTRHNAAIVAVASSALLAILWALPADLNRFDSPNLSWSQFRQAWTRPPLLTDGDWWAWNWIGHPFVGTHQYLMERNWGTSQRRAVLFSAISSLAWEYGWEATVERPSVQDMLLTAPVGWAIGESVHRLTQRMRRNGFTTTEKVVVVLLNPLYPLQHGFR